MVSLVELGRINLAESDVSEVLQRVAELAKAAVRDVAEISVTLITDGVATTAAHTGPLAIVLDERQYDSGHGPCLEAAAAQTVLGITDTSAPSPWPEFAAAAAENGIASTLAIGMPVGSKVVGALNVYLEALGGLDAEDTALLTTYASHASVVLSNAHLFHATATLARQMETAMQSRAVIEQAKGILVAQRRVTPDEAFAILSRASQAANRKLRDVAKSLVEGTAGQELSR
jgi:transcriptional regulator with GAF, ATPase, and Fis domain